MNLENACRSVLGHDAADQIIRKHGIDWAAVMTWAKITEHTDPDVRDAIDRWRG